MEPTLAFFDDKTASGGPRIQSPETEKMSICWELNLKNFVKPQWVKNLFCGANFGLFDDKTASGGRAACMCGALRQTRPKKAGLYEDRSVAPKGTTTTSTTTHSRMVIPVVPTQSACSYKTQKSEAQLGQMAEKPAKKLEWQ